jgi:colanic acid biosynthesis glycosyl transferase WcaI
VVASEGPCAKWLERQSIDLKLPSLRVIGFQPYAAYPDVLGSADVLISILEADAGHFSVPSKVLSYLCAGRPIVLSAPAENLASRILESSRGGKAIAAGDTSGLIRAVRVYLENPAMRKAACHASRSYAERTFRIQGIGNRFEEILMRVHREFTGDHRPRTRPDSFAAAAGR